MSRELRGLVPSYGVQVAKSWEDNATRSRQTRRSEASSEVQPEASTILQTETPTKKKIKKKKKSYEGPSGSFSKKYKWSESKASRRNRRQTATSTNGEKDSGEANDVVGEGGEQATGEEEGAASWLPPAYNM